ncbi:2OG-Fe(II) oxygenase family protein [Sphingomonas sp.]|uniref:2OG-Fe(II) oxygenase n=1 Tax=Sphingomonas sp. TaxID=28214 RepID=UPI001EC9ECF8|nr:2OG-Fe(II) oxygenase family protein [Sphingomonas sp.]MBX3595655.1 2OG-Fe(II) oxygenase [Sphingomonas sp.]
MPDRPPLLVLNPAHDPAGLARGYAAQQRLQIRDVLTAESARLIRDILRLDTAWGLAWQAGSHGPNLWREREVKAASAGAGRDEAERLIGAAAGGDGYAFAYSAYPMLTAYLERWDSGSAQDQLLEELNSPPMLDFVRRVTGIGEIVKADAQATLYAPGQFLAMHDDAEPSRGRRVAYVLNLCATDWRPDWGGYLNFYDDAGDVVAGYRPRFNALNLFTVPQPHNVTYVPPFAPVARFAITGWFRDR